jgi:hypothetical protein
MATDERIRKGTGYTEVELREGIEGDYSELLERAFTQPWSLVQTQALLEATQKQGLPAGYSDRGLTLGYAYYASIYNGDGDTLRLIDGRVVWTVGLGDLVRIGTISTDAGRATIYARESVRGGRDVWEIIAQLPSGAWEDYSAPYRHWLADAIAEAIEEACEVYELPYQRLELEPQAIDLLHDR